MGGVRNREEKKKKAHVYRLPSPAWEKLAEPPCPSLLVARQSPHRSLCLKTSSGGGGGTKGPEKLDKRNQEENCPYCDRIFKQARHGVLVGLKKAVAFESAGEGVLPGP